MKIAELFVALGFKVEGGDALARTDRNLMKAETSAIGLLAAVGALNAAFYVMMNRAVDAAVGLDRWQLATGKGVEQLQRMQHGAAAANVGINVVADAIKHIQRTRAEISLGNVDASSPWFLLGIDPRQDPVKVMDDLRGALARLDPALQRTMVTRLGFNDDVLYLLQQRKTLGGLFATPAEVEQLTRLGGAWKAFVFNLSVVATKFAATFADGLSKVVGWLDKGVVLLDKFVRWLGGGTTAAHAARMALLGLVTLLGVAGLALGVIVTLLGLLKAALVAIQLIPIVLALTALVGVLALMAAGIVALILLVQDFWTQIDGGKSLFDWNQNLVLTVKNVERLAGAIGAVIDLWRQLKGDPNFRNAFAGEVGKTLLSYGSGYGFARDFVNWNWGSRGGGGGNTNNQAKVEIHVDGARDPVTTGREVGRHVGREISDAFGTAPIPTN